MKFIELTADLLKPYFLGNKKHSGYEESVKEYKALKVHANGEYPARLIDERRPNESDTIKEYRKKIYEPITYDAFHRVLASLTKIRRSSEWIIKHNLDAYPTAIVEEERYDRYIGKDYPFSETLENWLFTIAFHNYAIDPNGIVLCRPIDTEIDTKEYTRPFPFFYNSPNVLEFIPDQLLILSLEKDTEEDDRGSESRVKRFLAVNAEKFERWVSKKDGDGFEMDWEYKHNLGVLPAFKAGGMYWKTIGRNVLMRSRLYPMLPRLNDAAREYSDMQAEVVQHIHSEKWSWANKPCPKCMNGQGVPTGFINNPEKTAKMVCSECGGAKIIASSPYKTMVIRPSQQNIGEQPAPIPPAGYIQKNIDIVRIQDERIDKHLFRALSALNMQFLDETPLNTSGKAKEVDRDELNNFVYSVAEDLVRIADRVNQISVEYRYKTVLPNKPKREKLVPEIPVPEKFDLLSSNYLVTEIKEIRDAKVNPIIASELEIELAAKTFYNNPMVKERVQAILMLDPMPGLTEDEKMVRVSTNGVTRLSYVISCNISQIIEEAMRENEDFVQLKFAEKKAKIEEIGQRILDKIDEGKIELPPIDKPFE